MVTGSVSLTMTSRFLNDVVAVGQKGATVPPGVNGVPAATCAHVLAAWVIDLGAWIWSVEELVGQPPKTSNRPKSAPY